MEVKAFEVALKFNRSTFRHILERGLKEICFEDEILNFKEWIIRECFGKCTSEFEEQTVMENLKEEFEDFLKGQMIIENLKEAFEDFLKGQMAE